jgi:hypothetical protein
LSDISRGGCYIETDNPLPIGVDAQLRLTIGDILLDIGARAVSITPTVGMGMEFIAAPQGQEDKLAKIMDNVTDIAPSPAVQQTEPSEPRRTAVHITREAAPDILARIIERINETGVLTRQELIRIVKSNQ